MLSPTAPTTSYESCARRDAAVRSRSAQQRVPRWRGWTPVVLLPALALILLPAGAPRWALMWAVALALYAGMKWLTWRCTPIEGVPWPRHAGYLLAWPGMDAAAFLRTQPAGTLNRPATTEWLFAAAKIVFGASLLYGATRLVSPNYPLVLGWVGLTGLVFALHFGVFHLLSCAWRAVGIDARPLMHWPAAAHSLSDFWGRRWNTAYRDLTHRFVFQPLAGRLGPRWGLLGGFAASGLVHDLVISVPAGGGYGGPTLFFGVQGAALLWERSRHGRRIGLGRGGRGWLFTALVLVAPACLLFHPPFVREVVLPMFAAWRIVP